jgi:hypothetical protein
MLRHSSIHGTLRLHYDDDDTNDDVSSVISPLTWYSIPLLKSKINTIAKVHRNLPRIETGINV